MINHLLPALLILDGDGTFTSGGGGLRLSVWRWIPGPQPSGATLAITAVAGIAVVAALFYTTNKSHIRPPWSLLKRRHALSPEQWRSMFNDDGTLCDGGVLLLKEARSGGVDHSIRAEVWPFLLGVYDLGSSSEERNKLKTERRIEYEKLRTQCHPPQDEPDPTSDTSITGDTSTSPQKGKSASPESFSTWQRVIRVDAIRANADWVPFSPSQSSVSETDAHALANAVALKDYENLEPCRVLHASRLVAILEAYAVYDPEIGYCQGMSDLLSPILAVIDTDPDAFWCFVGFMKRARHNFRLDEVGIRRQLSIVSKIIKVKDARLFRHLEMLEAEDCFFVYRMVVVMFRRELSFEQTMWLWEVMWADQAAVRAGVRQYGWRAAEGAPPTEDLLLYAIAASVLQRRKLIIERYSSMDEILRECNGMAGHLDVWKLLDDAHHLVLNVHDKIEVGF